MKWANLLSLGSNVDPSFSLHLKDKHSKKKDFEIEGLLGHQMASRSCA